MENSSENHEEIVKSIINKVFSTIPEKIVRMKIGLDNEVYKVFVKEKGYIIRLNKKDSLKGSSKNIPMYQSLGIKVPGIVAEDYTKEFAPYNYQVMEMLDGDDIGVVISTLSENELTGIAKEIANIAKKLLELPTNGKFGYVGNNPTFYETLKGPMQERLDMVKERNAKTVVVKKEYIDFFEVILDKYSKYFENTPSQFYFDDMSSKNVMIDNGKFNGLVDLDGYEFGDYLEGIGRIKASWYGTSYGDFYSDAVITELGLNESQKEMVTVYAIMNRICWLSEIGVQFNQNTTSIIDKEKVKENNMVINALIEEYKSRYC